MNRRQLLQATGWTAAGLTVLSSSGCGLLPPLPTFGESSAEDALAWVNLNSDGVITFLLPRAEIGQGIDTGLTLIVAEELQISPALIKCHYQRTDKMAPCQMTVGSQSIENYGQLTALAAASLRLELLRRAAQALDAPAEELQCRDGFVAQGDRQISLADLVDAEEQSVMAARTQDVPLLYLQANTRFVGRRAEAIHQEEIVTGAEIYSRDVTIPDMLFGKVAHPPQLTAKLLSANRVAAQGTPGVVSVVDGPEGQLGVVAETPMAAEQGLIALDCVWSSLSETDVAEIDRKLDIDQAVAEGLLDHVPINRGQIKAGRERAVTEIDARYDTPMAAHASMEPRSGVAAPGEAGLEVWTGSQDPWFVRSAVSKAIGLSDNDVVVHNCRVGGGFGGRIHCQASLEAAWLAHATQKPVKVQWTREDEFRYNYVGPQFSTRINAGVREDGKVTFWHHQMVGAPVLTSSMLIPPRLHWLANIPADPGTIRGVELPYKIENHRAETGDVRLPMPTGAWRGLGAAPNTFAVECAMDELAEAADIHPLTLRISNGEDPRYVAILERLKSVTAGEPGLGFAATAYKGVTFVALAAQVLQTPYGLRLSKIWCVHDCGRMVAPDRVAAQVEGNLVWGVSMALHELFTVENGIAATTNFDRYPIARQSDMPEFSIELVENNEPSSGAAEAALAPAGAAIANAVSRVTGLRQRALPIRELA